MAPKGNNKKQGNKKEEVSLALLRAQDMKAAKGHSKGASKGRNQGEGQGESANPLLQCGADELVVIVVQHLCVRPLASLPIYCYSMRQTSLWAYLRYTSVRSMYTICL